MKVEMHTEKINARPQNWFWGKKKKKRLLCRVGAQEQEQGRNGPGHRHPQ